MSYLMKKQQGQFLSMTVLTLQTFKRLYHEIIFEENVEHELINFFEYFMEIFHMPASQHIRSYCAIKLDAYLSDELNELETIKQILTVIKNYYEDPLKTKTYVKKFILKDMYGGNTNENF